MLLAGVIALKIDMPLAMVALAVIGAVTIAAAFRIRRRKWHLLERWLIGATGLILLVAGSVAAVAAMPSVHRLPVPIPFVILLILDAMLGLVARHLVRQDGLRHDRRRLIVHYLRD
jgi:4-hydroxybenzoate polyprenyltransferase